MTTLTSRADVRTDAPARYAKQLVSHLGRKATFTQDADGAWTTAVGDARGRIVVGDGVLTLHVEAPDAETLTRLEQAFGGHLERFGARAELAGQLGPRSRLNDQLHRRGSPASGPLHPHGEEAPQ